MQSKPCQSRARHQICPGTSTAITTIIVELENNTRTCIHTPGTCGELTIEDVEKKERTLKRGLFQCNLKKREEGVTGVEVMIDTAFEYADRKKKPGFYHANLLVEFRIFTMLIFLYVNLLVSEP